MYSSQGTINYPTQLHPFGNFCKYYIMMNGNMNVKSVNVLLSVYVPRRHIGELEVSIHLFLTSILDGVEWPISRPDRFAPGQKPDTHCVGDRVNPVTGLGDLQLKISHLNPEPCSNTLCHIIFGRNYIYRTDLSLEPNRVLYVIRNREINVSGLSNMTRRHLLTDVHLRTVALLTDVHLRAMALLTDVHLRTMALLTDVHLRTMALLTDVHLRTVALLTDVHLRTVALPFPANLLPSSLAYIFFFIFIFFYFPFRLYNLTL